MRRSWSVACACFSIRICRRCADPRHLLQLATGMHRVDEVGVVFPVLDVPGVARAVQAAAGQGQEVVREHACNQPPVLREHQFQCLVQILAQDDVAKPLVAAAHGVALEAFADQRKVVLDQMRRKANPQHEQSHEKSDGVEIIGGEEAEGGVAVSCRSCYSAIGLRRPRNHQVWPVWHFHAQLLQGSAEVQSRSDAAKTSDPNFGHEPAHRKEDENRDPNDRAEVNAAHPCGDSEDGMKRNLPAVGVEDFCVRGVPVEPRLDPLPPVVRSAPKHEPGKSGRQLAHCTM
mmetsp:Transcript_22633/g.57334  ORF Transcript_22633/g.57334 Transcript_22633/m.57334 type:complete len:288 (-) Transcript_22633:405-1268(-)